MDKNTLISNIIKYAEQVGESPTKVCEASGVGKDFLGNLRRGSLPSVGKVAQLAAYLGVTTSDLVGDARPAEGAKCVYRQPSIFNDLTPQQLARVRDFVAGMKAGE